jgi:hypothetical protein
MEVIMRCFEEIRSYILNQEIINTHSHHLMDSDMATLTLKGLLEKSYISWCGEPIPSSSAMADNFFKKISNRNFFVSLSRALQKLYAMDKPLSAAVWDEYDKRIRKAHENCQWHLDILKNICSYRTIVQDAAWDPGDNNGHPEIFKPALRVNYFLYGYNHKAKDHSGTNAQLAFGQHIDDIKAYTDFIYRIIKEKKENDCSSLKSAIAYDRSIKIEHSSAEEAQKALGFSRPDPSAVEIKKFQDYVFDVICDIAAELKMPFQIHTGLGLMIETNPMQIQSLIAKHPNTTFVLMHGGYPWIDDICGLVHVYPNVVLDLCWLPMISPSAAVHAIHELLEICNGNKIVWGCDTWTSEESFGSLHSMADVLARVLDEKIGTGYLNMNNALRLAEGIMGNNAKQFFCL